MGKSHRLAGLLPAGAAAVSLSLGTAPAAQATGLAPGTGAGPGAAAAPAKASCLPPGGAPPPPSGSDGADLLDIAVVSAGDVWTGGGTWTVVPSA